MTASPTPAERLALKTANAAILSSPNAMCDIVATIVFALGAAGLLMDPETAEELRQMQPKAPGTCSECGEPPSAWCSGCAACSCADGHDAGCPNAPAEDVAPQVKKLRTLLAGQREDSYTSLLHHDYKVPHDLPEVQR